jgi:hypothetical protein
MSLGVRVRIPGRKVKRFSRAALVDVGEIQNGEPSSLGSLAFKFAVACYRDLGDENVDGTNSVLLTNLCNSPERPVHQLFAKWGKPSADDRLRCVPSNICSLEDFADERVRGIDSFTEELHQVIDGSFFIIRMSDQN